MTEAHRDPTIGLDPRYFPTGAVIERPAAERPKHETIDRIIEWLAGPAQHIPSLGDEFDEFAWRMLAAGLPLLRTTLQLRTLHPQYLGATFIWWRTTGRTVLRFVTHEVLDLYGHEDNPVRRVQVGGETLRRRIDVTDDALDFPILHDLKAEGATDYFALPIKSSLSDAARRGRKRMTSFQTSDVRRRPAWSGRASQQIRQLGDVRRDLPGQAQRHS
jgi:hypothetical protein